MSSNSSTPKSASKQPHTEQQLLPTKQQRNTTAQQDIIRAIAADHPEQTVQLIKHWLKD